MMLSRVEPSLSRLGRSNNHDLPGPGRRNREAEMVGPRLVDHQYVILLGIKRHDWCVAAARIPAGQDSSGINADCREGLGQNRSEAHEAAILGILSPRVAGRPIELFFQLDDSLVL